MKPLFLAGLLTIFTGTAFGARTRIVPRESAPATEGGNSSEQNSAQPSGGSSGSQVPSRGITERPRTSVTPRPTATYSPNQTAPSGSSSFHSISPSVGPSDSGRPRTRIVRRPGNGAPSQNHGAIVQDRDIRRRIERGRRVEVTPDRYYWHKSRGRRYVHYYDRRHHWYGFYNGPSFYWSTYHADHWWWHDPHYDRWTYWSNGHWWWPSPTGVVYVYVNNDYRPYEEANLNVAPPEAVSPPVDAAPASVSAPGGTWTSPDSRRSVQVFGGRSEAFLYDLSVNPDQPRFMKFLGRDVEKVRFAGGTGGQPVQILLDRKDGSFALFTADGNPLNGAAAPSAASPATITPPPPPPVQP